MLSKTAFLNKNDTRFLKYSINIAEAAEKGIVL